ncbi:MAG: acetylglutamate kinase [Candidatus Mycalebacterium zealandia]|nr:MAG: acetylglutamate kinase [Candidatus Mycalebacterium zealandia]
MTNKATILAEAFPYIKQFYGKNVVVKYSGSLVGPSLEGFAQDIALMKFVGIKPVVVHGGGRQIEAQLKKEGIESRFIAGLRVTDKKAVKTIAKVLAGKVNKTIVTAIKKQGAKAVGISGNELSMLKVCKADIRKIAEASGVKIPPDADLGMVGEIKKVNPKLLRLYEKDGSIPVIAPIGRDSKGDTYNVNADHAAGKVASVLKAEKLIMLTDVRGIMDGKNKLIPSLNFRQTAKLIKEGTIAAGMRPKAVCCMEALSEGVRKAHIIDGRTLHALILEIFTDAGVGTEIKK